MPDRPSPRPSNCAATNPAPTPHSLPPWPGGSACPLIAREASLPAGGNLEQNARRARLAFFREAIASGAVERVAVGHTRSDQAETVLFRLLRGAGTAGLAGARPMTSDGIVRPLIDVERAEVEAFLTSRGIEWREDSTNASRRFARNRIRHELLPQLSRDWNPAIVDALARTADQAAADEDYWRAGDRPDLGQLPDCGKRRAVLWKLPERRAARRRRRPPRSPRHRAGQGRPPRRRFSPHRQDCADGGVGLGQPDACKRRDSISADPSIRSASVRRFWVRSVSTSPARESS